MNKEVEEAKNRLEYINRWYDFNDCYSTDDLNAIETILNYVQELEEKDKKYIVQLTDEQYRKLVDNIKNEYKQKIKDKIEEREGGIPFTDEVWKEDIVIKTLQELLKEE